MPPLKPVALAVLVLVGLAACVSPAAPGMWVSSELSRAQVFEVDAVGEERGLRLRALHQEHCEGEEPSHLLFPTRPLADAPVAYHLWWDGRSVVDSTIRGHTDEDGEFFAPVEPMEAVPAFYPLEVEIVYEADTLRLEPYHTPDELLIIWHSSPRDCSVI